MIEITGLEAVQRKLKGLAELGCNTEPLMHTIGNVIANSIKDSFEDEKSPFGQKWAALKPSTVAQKKRKGKSDKILRRDGYLADKWVVDATSKRVIVSNNSKHKGFAYGLVHQFGTHKAGRSKNIFIPARPFLPVNKSGKLQRDIQKIIKTEMIKFIKKI